MVSLRTTENVKAVEHEMKDLSDKQNDILSNEKSGVGQNITKLGGRRGWLQKQR